jgi:DNA-directed RNA polymerase subunit RPC12/RpoP
MATNQSKGDAGEQDVINHVPCPNCGKELMRLPRNYPLYDVQCSGCSFRAQVKTSHSAPKDVIRGAGWDVVEKVLKSGFMSPPLLVNFKWKQHGRSKQVILFLPFIPKSNLSNYRLSAKARRANYRMFNYVDLLDLPFFVLHDPDGEGQKLLGN